MGSPKVITATIAADTYFKAQLKLVCPITWGTKAIKKNNKYISVSFVFKKFIWNIKIKTAKIKEILTVKP